MTSTDLTAQVKNFEYDNPNAILLNEKNLELLMSKEWKIENIITDNRGNITETLKRGSIQYQSNRKFIYRNTEGTWELIEDKYIKHKFDNREDEIRLNFGGIYAVTILTDSSMKLIKVLTSSSDMYRAILLTSNENYNIAIDSKTNKGFYNGPINKLSLDSIRNLSEGALFESGFEFDENWVIIHTKDSIFQLPRKIE